MGIGPTVIFEIIETIKKFIKTVRSSANYEVKKTTMNIKVLGTGCARCKALDKVTRKAVEELNLNATIEKVEDIQKIMEYAVMRTPALVIDEKVLLSGQVPKVSELKELLTNKL